MTRFYFSIRRLRHSAAEPFPRSASNQTRPCAILNLSLHFSHPRGVGISGTMPGQPNPEFLRRAIALATQNVASTAKAGRFAAVIVRDGKIVGEGANSVTADQRPHRACRGQCYSRRSQSAGNLYSLAGCELYTSCEPCPMCLAAAYWARVDAVYYGASAADAARAGLRRRVSLRANCAKTPADRKLKAPRSCWATRHGPALPRGSRRAAVLGAGTMGSRIAAHLANAGIPTLLLDMVPAGEGDAEPPRARALSKPSPSPNPPPSTTHQPPSLSIGLITPGNFDDDLPKLAQCDWVIEAVAENLEIKTALLARVAPASCARTRCSPPTPPACR
jgi:guanine deaminase